MIDDSRWQEIRWALLRLVFGIVQLSGIALCLIHLKSGRRSVDFVPACAACIATCLSLLPIEDWRKPDELLNSRREALLGALASLAGTITSG